MNKQGRLYMSYYNVIARIRQDFSNVRIYAVASSIPPGCEKFIDKHMKALAPSPMFKQYKTGEMTHKDFMINYIREMKNSESLTCMKEILTDLKNGINVFLVCYEKNSEICHRFILANYLLGKQRFTLTCRAYPEATLIGEYINLNRLSNFTVLLNQLATDYPNEFSEWDRDLIQRFYDNIQNDNFRLYVNFNKNSKSEHIKFNDLSKFVGLEFTREWLCLMRNICCNIVNDNLDKFDVNTIDVLYNCFLCDENLNEFIEKNKRKQKKEKDKLEKSKDEKAETGINDYKSHPVKFKKSIKTLTLTDEDKEMLSKCEKEFNVIYDKDKAVFLKRLGETIKELLLEKERVLCYPTLCPMDNDISLVMITPSSVEWLHSAYSSRIETISEYWSNRVVFTCVTDKETEQQMMNNDLLKIIK